MEDQHRPPIRLWSWATMPPVGKRAYILKMGIELLRKEGVPVPESWMTAWVISARGLWEASPLNAEDEHGDTSRRTGIANPKQTNDPPLAVRLNEADWSRLRAMTVDAPLDEALLHKAAIEFILDDYGGVIPAELVEITLALS